MVFTGLLTSSDRPTRPASASSRPKASSSASEVELLPEYIHDEIQLPCIPPERPNLRELNNSLEALAAVFPDIRIEVFRELLGSFDGESRLALVADTLLKNRVQWVKGRWRVAEKHTGDSEPVPRGESFRSKEYITAVQNLAYQEFKGLSKLNILRIWGQPWRLAFHGFERVHTMWRLGEAALVLIRHRRDRKGIIITAGAPFLPRTQETTRSPAWATDGSSRLALTNNGLKHSACIIHDYK